MRGLVPHPRGSAVACRGASEPPRASIENPELLIGDGIALVSFCLYKQISSIVLSPSFAGWLAPLKFNPVRFEEFAALTLTLLGAWIGASLVSGGYRTSATSDLPSALVATSVAWLASMPVAAAELVLLTACENQALVGDEGFARVLPLAASGMGEPFVTAAGVLGVMAVWRSFYTVYLDVYNFKPHVLDNRARAVDELRSLQEALIAATGIAIAAGALMQVVRAIGV